MIRFIKELLFGKPRMPVFCPECGINEMDDWQSRYVGCCEECWIKSEDVYEKFVEAHKERKEQERVESIVRKVLKEVENEK